MQYTHGYGLTMSPVNVVTPEGLPDLFIQDIPPKSKVGIEITQPEIYYGELTDRFVLVGTKAKEFDFPNGDENAYTTYSGEGGVPVGTTLRQSLFSLYYQSFDILLSNYITPESKIMFRRQVKERVSTIAPFLHMDRDPYLVVVDGRMKWMLDAYTTTDRFPYAEPFCFRASPSTTSGTRSRLSWTPTTAPWTSTSQTPTDPMIQVYGRIFPGAFKAMEDMPESLVSHVRYPQTSLMCRPRCTGLTT